MNALLTISHRMPAFLTVLLVAVAGCGQHPATVVPPIVGAIQFQHEGEPLDAATDHVGDGVLTLAVAARQAVRHAPDVQAALSRVRAAEADAQQADLLPNPIFRLLARFPENSGKPVIDAELTADLLSILQRRDRVSAADDRLRAATADAVAAVLDVLDDVQEHYAAAQSLDALMPVLEERRRLLARLVTLAEGRLAKGEGTRLDVRTLDAQRLELDVEITERRLEHREERLALARLIGEPSGAADWKLDAWQEPTPPEMTEARWLSAAMDCRPDVQAQRWELVALGVEERLTRFAPFDKDVEAGAGSERDNVWTVGPTVTVPLPLFDWGQARRAKARSLRIEASHKLTKVRRQAVEEVRRAYATFEEAHAALRLVREQLLPAQQRRRLDTEAAYKAGLSDVTAIVLSDEDLQATQAKLIELQRRTSTALIRLQRAAGGTAGGPSATTGPMTAASPTATAE